MAALFALLFTSLFSAYSWADDLRPVSLTIQQIDTTAFNVSWTVPLTNGVRPDFAVKFSGGARQTSPKKVRALDNTNRETWQLKSAAGFAGETITIVGLHGSTYAVLLRLIDLNSQTITAELNTDRPAYVVPAMDAIEGEDTMATYIGLSIQHILMGLDHLLFVACLVYISATRKKLLLTITEFTFAHPVTLILAATEVLVISIPPAEAVIALSIILFAREIVQNNQASLSLRYPLLVSSIFGLLHGFGSVLADIGLPEHEKNDRFIVF